MSLLTRSQVQPMYNLCSLAMNLSQWIDEAEALEATEERRDSRVQP